MAFWQNGKLHIHTSTQGVAQAVFSFVRWLDLKPEDIVLVNAYTGGGYGSKGGGSITDIIPALLSKKLGGAPVMMRISREEEHAIGRARPAMHGRLKVGFTKEGRVTAVDMFTVTEGGPFGPGGDGNTASCTRLCCISRKRSVTAASPRSRTRRRAARSPSRAVFRAAC